MSSVWTWQVVLVKLANVIISHAYFSSLSLPFRWSGAVSFGLCVKDLVDLQKRVPTARGLHLDYRLWLGLYAAKWTDAAGPGSPGSFDASRFVLLSIHFVQIFGTLKLIRSFLLCRLDLARCSATHRCGFGGVQASLSNPRRRSPHPIFCYSTWTQHTREVLFKSSNQMQPENEAWVSARQTGRAYTPKACVLVWRSAGNTVWNSPVSGNWQKCREEGWRLVRPGYSGTYTTVTITEITLQEVSLFLIPFRVSEVHWCRFKTLGKYNNHFIFRFIKEGQRLHLINTKVRPCVMVSPNLQQKVSVNHRNMSNCLHN